MAKLIIANWKMQLSPKEAVALAKKFKVKANKFRARMVVCPDYLALPLVAPVLKNSSIKLGAQDCASQNRGSLTGEVSPVDLREAGVKYVIIGHSERRAKLGESGALINLKLKEALKNKLIPILCVGEKLIEKKANKTRTVLAGQLRSALKSVKLKSASDLIIAYEPLWSISPGRPITPAESELINFFITKEAAKILKKNVRVIYGGSADVKNAVGFLKQKHVAGLLVGAASLKENFSQICY
jgi:triosephosphate isomerase